MAYYHPQLVHFAIALLVVGVVLRLISLAGRPAFVAPAAFTLLLVGTIAATLAVQSGVAAHGPVERVPGARDAVVEHEEWGIRTRNVFFGVIAIEAVAFLLWRSPRRRLALMRVGRSSASLGLFCLYEAGEHGGELVYAYAGGVGIRSGDPADVERLLLAGLYNGAQAERKAGRATGGGEADGARGRTASEQSGSAARRRGVAAARSQGRARGAREAARDPAAAREPIAADPPRPA